MISISITMQDTASPTIADLAQRANPESLAKIAGRSGANVTRRWLRAHNAAHPNKWGAARTNFFAKAAAAVGYNASPSDATIYTQATGVLHARYGGTIRPSGRISTVTGQPIKSLAIPARAEAHGKVPADFNNLQFELIPTRDGTLKPALVETYSQGITWGRKKKDGTRQMKAIDLRATGGGVMFWLVKSVTHDADPSVLPPDDLVTDAVRLDMLSYLTRRAGAA